MSRFYANITLAGPAQRDVVAFLNERRCTAYVSPAVKGNTVIFHEDMSAQEELATSLSRHFQCPALLVMCYADTVLLYQLYTNGDLADAYVSQPHDALESLPDPVPEGSAAVLAGAFGVEHRTASIERVLRRPTHPTKGYALAVNRHGELARSLGLPLFAAGVGYRDIDLGELPMGQGFDDPSQLVRTGDHA